MQNKTLIDHPIVTFLHNKTQPCVQLCNQEHIKIHFFDDTNRYNISKRGINE
jgi:hypothetical protein